MPAFWRTWKGCPASTAPQLAPVADKGNARDAGGFGDAGQRVHLRHADERGLVDHEDPASESLPGLHEGCLVRSSVPDIPVAGEEPLEGPGRKAGLPFQRQRCTARGRQADHLGLARETHHFLQHRRLAGPGMALDTHEAVQ